MSGPSADVDAASGTSLLPVERRHRDEKRNFTPSRSWTQGNRRTTEQFEFVFPDVNPCTGDIHTVTIVLTESQHFHSQNFIGSGRTTITTEPTEFSGRGTTTFVVTKGAEVFRQVDILSDPAGNRIMANIIFVINPSTGDVRVADADLTCVHSVD